MFIDEYEIREALDKIYKTIDEQPDLPYSDDPAKAAQMREEKGSLTIPGSMKKELWIEPMELALEQKTDSGHDRQ